MYQQKIYLTFDLEEFDITSEFKNSIEWQEQINVSVDGLKNLLQVLNKHEVTATFFTTAAFANEQPAIVKQLSLTNEIASHTFYHSSFKNEDLKNSILALQQITGENIYGLRMPRMRQVDVQIIKQAGFTYDSSINPTRLPGRYNYTHLPRTSFFDQNLLRIPASVSPFFRLPLFWLAFKNMPYMLYKYLAKRTLKKDGYLNLYFHPWEFANLKTYSLPGYVKKPSGVQLLKKLDRLITDLKTMGAFDQLKNFEHKKASETSKAF